MGSSRFAERFQEDVGRVARLFEPSPAADEGVATEGEGLVEQLSRGVGFLTRSVYEVVSRRDALDLSVGVQSLSRLFDTCVRRFEDREATPLTRHPAFVAGRIAQMIEFAQLGERIAQSPDLATLLDEPDERTTRELALLLSKRPLSNREIEKHEIISTNASVVSRELNRLHRAGVLVRQRSGRNVYWSTSEAARRLLEVDELGPTLTYDLAEMRNPRGNEEVSEALRSVTAARSHERQPVEGPPQSISAVSGS